eukprot:1703276-Rhodomonas_salina.2
MDAATVVSLGTDAQAQKVCCGSEHTCVLLADGAVKWCPPFPPVFLPCAALFLSCDLTEFPSLTHSVPFFLPLVPPASGGTTKGSWVLATQEIAAMTTMRWGVTFRQSIWARIRAQL